ncbi:AtpZ/AtpI family protein [Marivita sp. GX14005]|uniref:AtpZ/AtpI family protein n=1 Tax=Marivita sp. GX14005 TaxID=2942276 RepID=UPI002019CB2D|nr:AtpZ/AtpI family protein [Marivita sp. GX14005]MCL3881968.1 AtpZ/AtpI family protein [Marivita sp. GX14005]
MRKVPTGAVAVSERDSRQRLAELEARIAAAKGAGTDKPHQEEHYSQAQHAWRMVIELVSGLGIGFGIGYGLDALFGTQPFLMVLFTLLGFAAGINVMIRSAREMQRTNLAERAGENERDQDGNGS